MTSVKTLVLQEKAFVKMIDWLAQFANFTTTMQPDWVEAMGVMFCKETVEKYIIVDAAGITSGNLVYVETSPQQVAEIVRIEEQLKAEDPNIFAGGWFHSHPGHSLFFSGTDTANQAYWQNSNPNGVGLVFDLTQVCESFIGFKFFRLDSSSSQGYHEVNYELHGFTEETLLQAFQPLGIDVKTVHRLAKYLNLKAKEGAVEFDKVEVPQTTDPVGTAKNAVAEAEKAYLRGNTKITLEQYRIANLLLKSVNKVDAFELYASVTLKLAKLCALHDYPETAQALIKEIKIFVQKMNLKPDLYLGKAEVILGYLSEMEHKPEDALFHYKKALESFNEKKYYRGLYKTNALAGGASWKFKNYQDAMKYFKDALYNLMMAEKTDKSKKPAKVWEVIKKGLSAKIASAEQFISQGGVERIV